MSGHGYAILSPAPRALADPAEALVISRRTVARLADDLAVERVAHERLRADCRALLDLQPPTLPIDQDDPAWRVAARAGWTVPTAPEQEN